MDKINEPKSNQGGFQDKDKKNVDLNPSKQQQHQQQQQKGNHEQKTDDKHRKL